MRRDFNLLWASESISLFGSQVTTIALPLVAVATLDASASEVGILNAARFAPFIAVTLVAGVLVDRVRRQPVLVYANAARALLLALVPLAAALDVLELEPLYVVAFLVGVLTVFFDLAYQSYLPTLVPREELAASNGKLQASASAAEVGGPGIGGLLVQAATAPLALLVDAGSFVISALLLSRIKADEPPSEEDESTTGTVRAIREGFGFTFGNAYLRAIAGEAATFNLFATALTTVFYVYAIRELDLSAGELGLILSVGAVGALAGSVLARYPAATIGVGPTILASMALACTTPLAIPFPTTLPALAAIFFVWGGAVAVSNVLVVSLRQAVTPDRMLGRMNASYRFFTYGAIPIGALFGGFLGELVGLRTTLLVSAFGLVLALAWVTLSPLWRLRDLSDAAA
jgi:MFS family permease